MYFYRTGRRLVAVFCTLMPHLIKECNSDMTATRPLKVQGCRVAASSHLASSERMISAIPPWLPVTWKPVSSAQVNTCYDVRIGLAVTIVHMCCHTAVEQTETDAFVAVDKRNPSAGTVREAPSPPKCCGVTGEPLQYSKPIFNEVPLWGGFKRCFYLHLEQRGLIGHRLDLPGAFNPKLESANFCSNSYFGSHSSMCRISLFLGLLLKILVANYFLFWEIV